MLFQLLLLALCFPVADCSLTFEHDVMRRIRGEYVHVLPNEEYSNDWNMHLGIVTPFPTTPVDSASVITTSRDDDGVVQFAPPTPSPNCLNSNTSCPICHTTKSCCMEENYNIYNEFYPGNLRTLSCGANNGNVLTVSSLEVFDHGAYSCNCNGGPATPSCSGGTTLDCRGKPLGTFFLGCTGTDDTVEVRFNANIQFTATDYDVAFYINTIGGSAVTATGGGCLIQGLSQTDGDTGASYPQVSPSDGDACLDVTTAATVTLQSHPFPKMTLKCRDTDNDGLLDFSVALTFAQNSGGNPTCNPAGPIWIDGAVQNRPPYPGGQNNKCRAQVVNLNVNVPNGPSPSAQPSLMPSRHPSNQPSFSADPSSRPSLKPSRDPSSFPTMSADPSSRPSLIPSRQPSNQPSYSADPSSRPSLKPSRDPSSNPTLSADPSSRPSAKPSRSPSDQPSLSADPSSMPSNSPTRRPTRKPTAKPTKKSQLKTSQPKPTSPTTRKPTRRLKNPTQPPV